MRHLRGWPDHLHVNVPDWTSLLRHVPTSYGIFLRLPAHPALGLCNSCTAKGEESCYVGIGDGCVECNEHCHCLPIPRVECTVSILHIPIEQSLTRRFSLYRMGCIVLTVALLCCATASLILRFWLQKLNRKSDQAVGLEGVANGPGLLFRYTL